MSAAGVTASAPRAAGGTDAVDAAGALFRRVSGSRVRNGTITGFDAGVAIRGGSDNTVSNVTVRHSNYRGPTVVNADPVGDGSNNVVADNDVLNPVVADAP